MKHICLCIVFNPNQVLICTTIKGTVATELYKKHWLDRYHTIVCNLTKLKHRHGVCASHYVFSLIAMTNMSSRIKLFPSGVPFNPSYEPIGLIQSQLSGGKCFEGNQMCKK